MWTYSSRIIVCLCSLGTLLSMASAGQDRIPEILARAGRSLEASAPPGSGWPAEPGSIEPLLRITDVIVRGRLGTRRSFLSDDEREVLTEYPIVKATTLYTASVSKPNLPPATTVRMKGGAVTINGLTYKETHEALRLPAPGTECLLLLQEFGGRYYVAGMYYGIFRIEHGRLKAMANDEKLPAYRDLSAPTAIKEIVAQRQQLGQ